MMSHLSTYTEKNEQPTADINNNLLEDDVNRYPLKAKELKIGVSKVNTYITRFISGNTTTETKLLP